MSGKNNTILVAGDFLGDLEKFAEHLRSETFNVLPVRSRKSVVTIARSDLPSLILLDYPTCFDTCRMLKHIIYLSRELLKIFSRTRHQRNFATFLDEAARQRGTETGSDTCYDGYPNIRI